ncbi:MAG: PDZ domain-containing protein [Gammaproteobacteria bacterium]|nr:PDZ domain-containing protein [Gammaproteobacteria bacterium]
MPKFRLSLIVACTLSTFSALAAQQQGYYRAPALHQDQLVFTAEGDLWLQQLGSTMPAQRLTTHPAEEINAQWSKDGQWLAYQANYDGVTEVYVLSKEGGLPKRVTFENSRIKVQGWTNDGKILYSTDHQIGPANRWLLKTIDPISLRGETLPLADAVEGVIDAKGEYVYFIRYGLQLTGDNAKVYRGGASGQLWRYRLGSKTEATRLAAEHLGSVRQVQLWRDKILLISDASGNANIWQFELDGSAGKPVTQEQEFQLRSFRVDGDNAVYQLGADVYQLDLASTKRQKLQLALRSDAPYQRPRFLEKPLTYLTSASLAAKSDKVVATVRGQLAVLSKPSRRAVTIATPEQSRSRSAVLSPDGKFVYAINDQSGENEIWRFQADGRAEARQLTKDGHTFRWGLYPSPDGRYLAHDDKDGNLWLLELSSGSNQLIYRDGSGLSPYEQVVWSGDSQQLAFTFEHKDRARSQVVLYQLKSKQSQLLTTENYLSYSPAFSPDGNWLYFLSQRQFDANPASPWGDRNMGPAFDKRTQVYALALTQGASQPFLAPTELTPAEPSGSSTDHKGPAKPDMFTVLPLAKLPGPLFPIPVPAGNYSKLELNDKFLFLLDYAAGAQIGTLKTVAINALKPDLATFSGQVADFSLSHDGKQLLLSKKPGSEPMELLLLDATAKAPDNLQGKAFGTDDLSLSLNPAAEWQQMFNDAWIMHRDSLFDPKMRGVDWQASKKRFQPLLNRVRDRYELDDIFSQMMGELDALHSQVRGSDFAKSTEAGQQATLGAELRFADNAVFIQQIYQTDADLPLLAAPLAKAGVDAKAGDQIVAINGHNVTDIGSYHQALLQQQGKQVLLSLKRQGKLLQTVVEAISPQQDTALRYSDWVQSNKKLVSAESQQQVGYLHLNAMTSSDVASFARDFYTEVEKPGLIIDVRRNRGGNIDSILIEKLLRRAWAFWQPVRGKAYPNMQQSFNGKLVVLTDELTYSDGETFAAGIKTLGLGTLIGRQTAGAGVWLSGRNLLSDYGVARVAETAQHAMDGRWIIEGRGVSPDLEVENLPLATFNGHDAQLAAAISYLQQQLKQHPPVEMQALPITGGSAADAKALTTK